MFCCMLLYVHSSIAIILMGKRELVALLYLSSWCLVMVVRLFLAVPWGCLRFVIVVFPDHTHLLFLNDLVFKTRQQNAYKWPFWEHIIDQISKTGNVRSLKYSDNRVSDNAFLHNFYKVFLYDTVLLNYRYNMNKFVF